MTWTVTFVEGRYRSSATRTRRHDAREFVVGNPPPATASAAAEARRRRSSLATVGPSSTISLKSASGKALKTVKAGVYSITVRDRSKVHNFHLVGKGVNRKSGLAGVGHGDVEGQALGRGAPLLLRQEPQDRQGLGQGHLGPAARLDQAGVLAARRADLGLAFELRVQLARRRAAQTPSS